MWKSRGFRTDIGGEAKNRLVGTGEAKLGAQSTGSDRLTQSNAAVVDGENLIVRHLKTLIDKDLCYSMPESVVLERAPG